jgi:hypothetical protein
MCLSGCTAENQGQSQTQAPEANGNGGFPYDLPAGSAGGLSDGSWWVSCQEGYSPRVSDVQFDGAFDVSGQVRGVGGTINGGANGGSVWASCEPTG